MTQVTFPQNTLGGSSHSFAMLLPMSLTRGHLGPTQGHVTAARGLPHLCYPHLLSPTLGKAQLGFYVPVAVPQLGGSNLFRVVQPVNNYQYNAIRSFFLKCSVVQVGLVGLHHPEQV